MTNFEDIREAILFLVLAKIEVPTSVKMIAGILKEDAAYVHACFSKYQTYLKARSQNNEILYSCREDVLNFLKEVLCDDRDIQQEISQRIFDYFCDKGGAIG